MEGQIRARHSNLRDVASIRGVASGTIGGSVSKPGRKPAESRRHRSSAYTGGCSFSGDRWCTLIGARRWSSLVNLERTFLKITLCEIEAPSINDAVRFVDFALSLSAGDTASEMRQDTAELARLRSF